MTDEEYEFTHQDVLSIPRGNKSKNRKEVRRRMSKALEALNKIQHDFGQLKGQELVSCYETIFNALKRLEAIDNANPSEALECLEKIIDNLDDYADFEIKQEANEYIDTIKQSLLKAQELEKENELLKEIIKRY